MADATRPRLPHAVLAGLVLAEVIAFSIIGQHFATAGNAALVLRLATELGLVSLAMTAVVITGGIDLSVGSTLGLSAVLFGLVWRDGHLPLVVAVAVALLIGLACGLINAVAVTRLRVHPLIVTLATLSLYRGLAQGITGGVQSYSGFPPALLRVGDHPWPALAVAAVVFYLLVHRSTVGRAWSAIGYSPEGARHAGIPVGRRVGLAYVLSGLMAAAAAVVYVARVGQAKADAGTGLELSAVTAVVLGGTSIFGGRGSVVGTLLGLLAIVVLRDGLQLSDGPPELANMAVGGLLLTSIGLDRRGRRRPATPVANGEEPEMRNSQLAVLCGVIVASALIVVGGNAVLIRRLARPPAASAARPVTIGMMPKSVGNAYFVSCHGGANAAAAELGDPLLWDGPTDTDASKQTDVVDGWVQRGVDVVAVSVEDKAGLGKSLRAARARGVKVVTWDADADPADRDWFVNQATPQGIGTALMDAAAKTMGNRGHFVIVTATLSAANQNEWIGYVKRRLAERYPDISCDGVEASNDQQAMALDVSKAVLNAHPDVTLLMAITTQAVPGAAEAVTQLGRRDVHVVGLGLPNDNKAYVHAGVTTAVILWNTTDLGYLAARVADAAARGTLRPGATSFDAGRLGTVQVRGDNVMLGVPFVFDATNIDGFDF